MTNKGFSLIEMLISLTLGGLIVAVTIGLLVSNTRSLTFNEIRGDLNNEARAIETLISRDVRMAGYQVTSNPLEISPTSLTSRYVRNDTLETVEYSFSDGRLTRAGNPLGLHVTSFGVEAVTVNGDTVRVAVEYELEKAGISRQYQLSIYPRNLNLN